MKQLWLATLVLTLLVGASLPASAELSEEEQEAWNVILESWEAIVAKDVDWTDKYVLEDALVWGSDYPMPRSRDSIKKWDRFGFEMSTTLTSDYSLGGIVVHAGTTAVAHYYYSLGQENQEGKKEVVHGRCTDILAWDGDTWRFIAWNCGDEPKDD